MVSQAGGEKKEVAPWMLIVAAVALLALLGWWGYKNFGPQDPPLTAKNVATNNMLEEMAKKSKGDFSKLSPEEQAKVREATGPYAPMVINNTARKLGIIK
ncbi:MAG: hypothetical protein SFU56_03470 [Capsulimonadales bacterium]|nr:hypothetical protein [Capsulimonadales bacterium]